MKQSNQDVDNMLLREWLIIQRKNGADRVFCTNYEKAHLSLWNQFFLNHIVLYYHLPQNILQTIIDEEDTYSRSSYEVTTLE